MRDVNTLVVDLIWRYNLIFWRERERNTVRGEEEKDRKLGDYLGVSKTYV